VGQGLLAETGVPALGRLEPRDGVVAVVGPTGDQIKEFAKEFHQGDKVNRDEELVRLESLEARQREEELAKRQLSEAGAQAEAIKASGKARLAEIDQEIEDLKTSKVRELALQKVKIEALAAQKDQAEREQRRVRSLPRDVVNISDQEIEQQNLAVRKASAELEASQKGRDNAEKTFDSNVLLAQAKRTSAIAEFNLALQRVPLESARQQVKIAAERTRLSTLRSPLDGTIVRLAGHPGDATGLQPILHIAAGGKMIAVCEVDERWIQKLAGWLGPVSHPTPVKATLTSSALPGVVLEGELKSHQDIAGMLARNAILSFNPRADVDRRVVEVRVELKEESARKAAGLIGLQTDVTFKKP
jgi:ABC exporter DevB family membrane fusion protein